MAAFEDIRIGWGGKEFVVPSTRVLECIAQIEEVLTLHEVLLMGEQRRVKLAPVSKAYAVALRFAGCAITDDEAYAAMFRQQTQEGAMKAVAGLLTMMLPTDMKGAAGAISEAANTTKGKARSPRSRGGSSSRSSGKRR